MARIKIKLSDKAFHTLNADCLFETTDGDLLELSRKDILEVFWTIINGCPMPFDQDKLMQTVEAAYEAYDCLDDVG